MKFFWFLMRKYDSIKGRFGFDLGVIYILGMLMKFVYGQVQKSLQNHTVKKSEGLHDHSTLISRFSHDVTKIQTKELLILLAVYFLEVLQQPTNFIYTKFRFERLLRFAIEDV